MNNDVLTLLKNSYARTIADRDEKEEYIIKLITKQKFLSKHPNLLKHRNYSYEIKEFFDNYQSDDAILDTLVEEAISQSLLNDTNNIYFYAGTFMNDGETTWQVPKNSSKAQYDLYLNVENCRKVEIPITERSNFEKENHIVSFYKTYPTMNDFESIHHEFFKSSINEDQETACQRVLNRKF